MAFTEAKGGPDARLIEVPCGQCINCRNRRSNDAKVRQVLEAKLHDHNVFVTLTYGDEHLPVHGNLDRKAIPGFVKRLRDHLVRAGRNCDPGDGISYFGCGEFGENATFRPHYHLNIFNLALPDMVPWRKSDSGELSYRSEFLERAWSFGHVECAPATVKTMAYTSGYVVKKLTGDAGERLYVRPDVQTGEVHQLEPPFALASREPAIGLRWLRQWKRDLAAGAFIMIDGRREPVPTYFLRKLEAGDPPFYAQLAKERGLEGDAAARFMRELAAEDRALFEKLAVDREQHGVEHHARIAHESSPERLAVKAEIAFLNATRRRRDLGAE